MKKLVVVAVVVLSFAASGIGLVGKSRGARPGVGKRLDATMADRSKPRASTNGFGRVSNCKFQNRFSRHI